ncbi:hypothetical protein SMA75_20130 [Escherichia coli]|uniref:hypothetical protein n=1 Tax=Escherichia coli TaxID=562 RepID=UPI003078F150
MTLFSLIYALAVSLLTVLLMVFDTRDRRLKSADLLVFAVAFVGVVSSGTALLLW